MNDLVTLGCLKIRNKQHDYSRRINDNIIRNNPASIPVMKE